LGLKIPASGQFLSIDVVEGRDSIPSANQLLESKAVEGRISTWGASKVFSEIEDLKVNQTPSPRTLVLLYAADLFFRLRWEVVPALDEGRCVVAVPYVATGVAFGVVVGLPITWLTEVFRFAPQPSERFHVSRTPSAEPGASSLGFVEFCSMVLKRDMRSEFAAYFDELQKRGVSRPV
jgi:hypothetical protein